MKILIRQTKVSRINVALVTCMWLFTSCLLGVAHSALPDGSFGYQQGSAGQVYCSSPTNFLDISTTGTSIPSSSDDSDSAITLPFPFDFFGVTYTAGRIGNNGGLLFANQTGHIPAGNTSLPFNQIGGFDTAILPFWDDLDDERGGVFTQTILVNNKRQFHIQWTRPHHDGIGDATIKAILYEGSNSIHFAYPDLNFGNVLYDNGVSATVGIQKDSTTAITTSFNQNLTTLLTSPSLEECFEPRRTQIFVTVESLDDPSNCTGSLVTDPITFRKGEEVRFCINVFNSTSETFGKHRVTSSLRTNDLVVQSLAGDGAILVIQNAKVRKSGFVTFDVTSFDPIAEGEVVASGGLEVTVAGGSVLDFLPAIVNGEKK